MTKTTDYKTKKKQQLEATDVERRNEVIEWMKTQFTATAKSRELLEQFYEGKLDTDE